MSQKYTVKMVSISSKKICDSFGFESTKKLTKQQYFNLVEAVNERMVKDEIQEIENCGIGVVICQKV